MAETLSVRAPRANLILLLNDGACKLFVCPICLDTSTNAVPCYGTEESPHPDTELVRVGPWSEAGAS